MRGNQKTRATAFIICGAIVLRHDHIAVGETYVVRWPFFPGDCGKRLHRVCRDYGPCEQTKAEIPGCDRVGEVVRLCAGRDSCTRRSVSFGGAHRVLGVADLLHVLRQRAPQPQGRSDVRNGELKPAILAKWQANAPLAMIDQYITNLRQYKAIAMDAGTKDQPIEGTVETLDKILTSYGIPHTFESYDGDHLNRIADRLEKKVMPFLAASFK